MRHSSLAGFRNSSILSEVMSTLGSGVKAVGLVSRSNSPILIHVFDEVEPEIRYHYVAHTALDVIEERVLVDSRGGDQFLGLLYTMEELMVYGYITNTSVKIVLMVGMGEQGIPDAQVAHTVRRIHRAYLDLVSNPFWLDEVSTIESYGGSSQASLAGAEGMGALSKEIRDGKRPARMIAGGPKLSGSGEGGVGINAFVRRLENICWPSIAPVKKS